MSQEPPAIEVAVIETAPLAENTYLVWQEGQTDAVVIDPGIEVLRVLEEIARRGLNVAAIFNTHGHGDHIGGNRALKEQFPDAPLLIGRNDAPMLADPTLNLSFMAGLEVTSPPADVLLDDGDTVEYAGLSFEVLAVPGHTPGHVAYLLRATTPWSLFAGDVLFAGSIGRTDIPGGDPALLLHSIRTKLLSLPAETRVYPGHGPSTTIGHEKWTNPFL